MKGRFIMKIKAKHIGYAISIIAVLLFSGCVLPFDIQASKAKGAVLPILPTQSYEERTAFNFLQNKLQDGNGVLVYSVNKSGLADYAVSESMGQAMEYAALSGNKDYFTKISKLTEQYFLAPSGYYYWKVSVPGYEGSTSSALIDDLRIFKAYALAQKYKFGDYQPMLHMLAERIYKFDINVAGYPCDYYDGSCDKRANEVSLFYLDSQTVAMLVDLDKKKWQSVHDNVERLLLNMPNNRLGLYPAKFNLSSQQYIWGDTVNMVENLYTALNLDYIGGDVKPLLKFLKSQITRHGKIYNWYYLNGTESDPNESTAVYALAARLFALNGDSKSAQFCLKKVVDFQLAEGSTFVGGFGDEDSGLVYTFDQLEALLMLRMVEGTNE